VLSIRSGQMTYDLRRLRLAGLIRRIEHANRYVLTPDGIKFAVFYTKLHNRLLRPLMAADQPQAPPEIRAWAATWPMAASTVRSAQSGLGRATCPSQNRDLMSEDQDLRVLPGVTARQQHEPAEHADHAQLAGLTALARFTCAGGREAAGSS
jgi:hypothetical protein